MAEGGVAQVYMTAGKPIDTAQVKKLMRECLAEKISSMLGTREVLDRTPGDVTKPSVSQPEPRRAATNQSEEMKVVAEVPSREPVSKVF